MVPHSRNHSFASALHATFSLALFLSLISLSSIHAQSSSFVPTPLWGMTSVFIEGRGLFVHGGQYTKGTQSVATSMTFSIDLSTPWETNQPKYTLMTMEGPTDYMLTSVLFTDNNGWLMVSNATGSKLRLDNLVWSEVSFGTNIMNKDKGLAAATDPITGSMYIINGGVENGVKRTFTYNEVINQYKEIGQTVPMESGFAGAWTNARKTMLIHGGIKANVVQDSLYEFTPSNNVPVIQPVIYTGDAPTARQGHCLVSAYGGSKMIVFGGIGATNATLGDIYILDAGTMKWTKGVDGGASVARAYTACAVSNDMFVAWGGCDGALTTLTSNVTIVYNLKTNQWVPGYSPFPYVAPTTSAGSAAATPSGNPLGTPSETPSGTGEGSKSGGIIGGVVGGLAVIGIVIALYIFRQRRQVNNDKTTIATSAPVTVGKDNVYYNDDKMAPHTDPNAHPTSFIAGSTPPPRFHIFQPSTSEVGPVYQLAFIDHHQQNQLLMEQQQQQQQKEQQQKQAQNPQPRHALKDPQTVDTASPSPMTSVYATSTNSNPGTNSNQPMAMMTTSNGNSANICQFATRNPHTSDDTQIFAGVPSPERHPHTAPH